MRLLLDNSQQAFVCLYLITVHTVHSRELELMFGLVGLGRCFKLNPCCSYRDCD